MARRELFDYQLKASAFVQRTNRCILRLDTGLGKTAVCIDAVKSLEDVKNVLVIVPAFLRLNWLREIKMWGGYSHGQLGEEINWCLVSYSKLARAKYLENAKKTKWDMVICDEAHYLKNWEAKRTRNIILGVLGNVKRVVLSTATPFVRSAADLHPLYSICEPGRWGKIGAFQERYCKKKPNHFKRWKKFDYYGARSETVGELKLASLRFMISYKKSDVLRQLPNKIETDLEFEVPGKFHTDNMELEEYIDVDTGKMKGGLTRILSKEAGLLGVEKVKVAKEWIDNLDKKEPFVIFCKHLEVQRLLVEAVKDLGLSFAKISGATSNPERDSIVVKFQAGEINCLVATMGSCGVGINLTAASKALFVELPWSYAELKQCEDRLHRIGQKNCVHIFRLIAKETIDEIVCGVLNRKIEGEELSIGSM